MSKSLYARRTPTKLLMEQVIDVKEGWPFLFELKSHQRNPVQQMYSDYTSFFIYFFLLEP